MKRLLCLGATLLSLGAMPASAEESKTSDIRKYDAEKGFVGPDEYFTGKVKVEEPFQSGDNFADYQGAMVHFSAGARTAWHTHPKGQSLYIASGEGRVQIEGKPVQTVTQGDVVLFPANTRHWHGAAPNQAMSHLAIQSPDTKGDVVEWMEQVTDEDYLSTE